MHHSSVLLVAGRVVALLILLLCAIAVGLSPTSYAAPAGLRRPFYVWLGLSAFFSAFLVVFGRFSRGRESFRLPALVRFCSAFSAFYFFSAGLCGLSRTKFLVENFERGVDVVPSAVFVAVITLAYANFILLFTAAIAISKARNRYVNSISFLFKGIDTALHFYLKKSIWCYIFI